MEDYVSQEHFQIVCKALLDVQTRLAELERRVYGDSQYTQ